jgi:hypothetical protein
VPLVPDGRRIEPERRGDARVGRLLAQPRELEPRVDNRALRWRRDRAEPRDVPFRTLSADVAGDASCVHVGPELVGP